MRHCEAGLKLVDEGEAECYGRDDADICGDHHLGGSMSVGCG